MTGGARKRPVTPIGTEFPLYVWGDYNDDDSQWQPASFASDAFTILSSIWLDSNAGEGVESTPVGTKAQAALLSGHSPTPFFGSPDGGGWLNNFPRFMQELSIPGNPMFDMGAIDILRARERGVPRYNEFRRQLGLNPIRTFDDLTDDKAAVARIKEVYGDDVESRAGECLRRGNGGISHVAPPFRRAPAGRRG